METELLAHTTAQRNRKFLYKNIITKFEIPYSITTDNNTQFTDTDFRKLVTDLNIKHQYTSVEHPQTNKQTETAK
ncbi:hypothetical protein DF186_14810, partial [Enterococcus hirae]